MPADGTKGATKEQIEQELQKRYMQLQILKHQLNAYSEEKAKIEQRIEEMRMTKGALEKLGDVPPSEEMWSSLGSGISVVAEVKDTKNVMINIGAGVLVKVTVPRSIELVDSQIGELEQVNVSLTSEVVKLGEEVDKLEPIVQRLAQRL